MARSEPIPTGSRFISNNTKTAYAKCGEIKTAEQFYSRSPYSASGSKYSRRVYPDELGDKKETFGVGKKYSGGQENVISRIAYNKCENNPQWYKYNDFSSHDEAFNRGRQLKRTLVEQLSYPPVSLQSIYLAYGQPTLSPIIVGQSQSPIIVGPNQSPITVGPSQSPITAGSNQPSSISAQQPKQMPAIFCHSPKYKTVYRLPSNSSQLLDDDEYGKIYNNIIREEKEVPINLIMIKNGNKTLIKNMERYITLQPVELEQETKFRYQAYPNSNIYFRCPILSSMSTSSTSTSTSPASTTETKREPEKKSEKKISDKKISEMKARFNTYKEKQHALGNDLSNKIFYCGTEIQDIIKEKMCGDINDKMLGTTGLDQLVLGSPGQCFQYGKSIGTIMEDSYNLYTYDIGI